MTNNTKQTNRKQTDEHCNSGYVVSIIMLLLFSYHIFFSLLLLFLSQWYNGVIIYNIWYIIYIYIYINTMVGLLPLSLWTCFAFYTFSQILNICHTYDGEQTHLLHWSTDAAEDSSSTSSVIETVESFLLSSEPLANFTRNPRCGPLLGDYKT
jgi:hypothetical protein